LNQNDIHGESKFKLLNLSYTEGVRKDEKDERDEKDNNIFLFKTL
jgi:hypothetical protein